MSVPFKYKQFYRDLFDYLSNSKSTLQSNDFDLFSRMLDPPPPSSIVESFAARAPLSQDAFLSFIAESQKATAEPYDTLLWKFVAKAVQYNLFAGDSQMALKDYRQMIDSSLKMHKKEAELTVLYTAACPAAASEPDGAISSTEVAAFLNALSKSVSLFDVLKTLLPKKRGGKVTNVPPPPLGSASPTGSPLRQADAAEEPASPPTLAGTASAPLSALSDLEPQQSPTLPETPSSTSQPPVVHFVQPATIEPTTAQPPAAAPKKQPEAQVSSQLPKQSSQPPAFRNPPSAPYTSPVDAPPPPPPSSPPPEPSRESNTLHRVDSVPAPRTNLTRRPSLENLTRHTTPTLSQQASSAYAPMANMPKSRSFSDEEHDHVSRHAPQHEQQPAAHSHPNIQQVPQKHVLSPELERMANEQQAAVSLFPHHDSAIGGGILPLPALPNDVHNYVTELDRQRQLLGERLEAEMAQLQDANAAVAVLKNRIKALTSANAAYFAAASITTPGIGGSPVPTALTSLSGADAELLLSTKHAAASLDPHEAAALSPFYQLQMNRARLQSRMEEWLQHAKAHNTFLMQEVLLAREGMRYDKSSAALAAHREQERSHFFGSGKLQQQYVDASATSGGFVVVQGHVGAEPPLHTNSEQSGEVMSPYRIARFYSEMAKKDKELEEKQRLLAAMNAIEAREHQLAAEIAVIEEDHGAGRSYSNTHDLPFRQQIMAEPERHGAIPEELFYAQRPMSAAQRYQTANAAIAQPSSGSSSRSKPSVAMLPSHSAGQPQLYQRKDPYLTQREQQRLMAIQALQRQQSLANANTLRGHSSQSHLGGSQGRGAIAGNISQYILANDGTPNSNSHGRYY